jgi:hypothetical protein
VIDIVFCGRLGQMAPQHLEIDMIQSPTILNRRNIFRAGAALAIAATASPLLTPASAQAEDARQADAEPANGNGFYRFKIGDFQATRDLGWLRADSDQADPRHERL